MTLVALFAYSDGIVYYIPAQILVYITFGNLPFFNSRNLLYERHDETEKYLV